MTKVSIIIPIYNTSMYLSECLNSIISQTHTDIEIICVNDGSTDNSREIVEEYLNNDSRIILINREESSGSAAVPRNIGLEMATGKYVVFIDSDDYIANNMIEMLLMIAENNDLDLVLCDNYVVTENGYIMSKEGEIHHEYAPMNEVFSYKDIPDIIFQISNAAIWHRMIKKELFDNNCLRFQENVPVLDDIYCVNMLLVLAKRIMCVNEKLMFYRCARVGAQTQSITKNYESIFKAFNKLYMEIDERGIFDCIKQSLVNWTLITMSWWYESIKDRSIAEKIYNSYKSVYIDKWKISDISSDMIMDYNKEHLKYFTEEEYRPSLWIELNERKATNANVIIYGAGNNGREVYRYVKEIGCQVVLWVDQNYKNIDDTDIPICSPSDINSTSYDFIIISIVNKDIINSVRNYLIAMGVDNKLIIDICNR